MKRARAKAWCVTALAALAVCCRFRYERLELPSTSDGGVASNGGDAASGLGGVPGALGGAPEPVDGGARSAGEGGGAAAAVGGTSGATSGTSGSNTGGSSGSSTGGSSAGAGGEPSVCVPDASCSCDVFQGHEYRFCGVLTTREAGSAACQSSNMVLTRVDSADENAWLLQRFIDHDMFIGTGGPIVIMDGNDIQVEGEWRWDDGTLFWDSGGAVGDFYTNWAFPPKAGQGDCVGMMSSGLWEDRSCSSGNATVACESP